MRLYTFVNALYLKPVQHGIQSAHIVHELFLKYSDPTLYSNTEISGVLGLSPSGILWNWTRTHKTIVVLDGGICKDLFTLIDFFAHPENQFPWTSFYEDNDSLMGALTAVGIVLPEEVYNAAKVIRDSKGQTPLVPVWPVGYNPTNWEQSMALRLNDYGLAR